MDKPKIRFKGYTEAWEQRKLGDVTKEFKSGNALKADEIDITGEYPVYGGNGLRGYTSTYNHDGEFALIGRQGALCGNTNYSVGKAYFTEHAVVVKTDENNDTRFMYYMLDTMNLGQYSDQSAQPGLAVNKLVRLENLFPKQEEQQRIGLYFKSLDHLITLHQRKCDELQKLKKFMLQNMFTNIGNGKSHLFYDMDFIKKDKYPTGHRHEIRYKKRSFLRRMLQHIKRCCEKMSKINVSIQKKLL